MEELNQFLNSVESSARRILKQQNKKQQELLVKERAALTRAAKHNSNNGSTPSTTTLSASSASPAKTVSRDELKATYSPGGALIVQAPPTPTPTSPLKSPSRHHSEVDDSGGDISATYLPRISQPTCGSGDFVGRVPAAASSLVAPFLPAIDNSKTVPPTKDPAVESTRKAQRDKRTADKILSSPLYMSMAKSKADVPQGFGGGGGRSGGGGGGGGGAMSSAQSIKKAIYEVDNVNLLLKKLGMREANSPSRRPDHAVEKRMCHACWVAPNKTTGCEHHARALPSKHSNNNPLSGLSDEAQMLRHMELQGPTSWLSDDLHAKYRSEPDREKLWRAFCRLQDAEAERERLGEVFDVAVVPLIVRHPICEKYSTQLELENLKVQAETRRRNQTKSFVFDVNHIWLTNLDHFNDRLLRAQRRRERHAARQRVISSVADRQGITDDDDDSDEGATTETNALRDRRDEAAIRDGYSQISSISTSRALQHAVFPAKDHQISTPTLSLTRQRSVAAVSTPSTPMARRRKRPRELPFKVPPLTLLVCGPWNPSDPVDSSALARVPGVALVGNGPVLWWSSPHDDDPQRECTKAVAIFHRSKTLSSTNAILVLLTLALDAPLHSPLWVAWHIGSKSPPPQLYDPPNAPLVPPQHMSPCLTSLLQTRLHTRIDSLLPGTIMLLNSKAQGDDFVLELDEPYAHRRLWPQSHERDSFRQWWRDDYSSLTPNFDVDPQLVSVQVALANATGVGGRFSWHSVDVVRHHVNHERREKDYLYIIENHATSGSNGAMWFAVSMTHEVMKDVVAAKMSAYLQQLEQKRKQKEYEDKLVDIEKKIEMGRLQLEAKRQEQKRIEQELSAKVAQASDRFATDSMSEDVLHEWEDRLELSVVKHEQVGWQLREITQDQSRVVFYYSLNEALPRCHRFRWDKPLVWPQGDVGAAPTSRSDASGAVSSRSERSGDASDDDADEEEEEEEEKALSAEQRKTRDAIVQMANALLADEQFLRVLTAKLGLEVEEDEVTKKKKQQRRRRSTIFGDHDDGDDDAEQVDLRDHMVRLTEEQDRSKASLMAAKMAKLQLPTKGSSLAPSLPGEGWKRLKVSRLPRNFARSVYGTHSEGPRAAFLNQPNHSAPVGMIDPREASPYVAPDYIPELRTLLVPKASADLQEKKLQWAEYVATLPSDQHDQPAASGGASSSPTRNVSATNQTAKGAPFERDPAEKDMTVEQLVAKAVLCARNNNLQGLEDALDGGCEINARDSHGNTLFILVCQQGNKKMAKFLMRRHADVNLQNLNGNTALHYLIEYKHAELAAYLKAHGAVDTTQNAAGLTCYEGLSMDHVEAL